MDDDEVKVLLKALLQVTARGTFPEDRLREMVMGRSPNPSRLIAYNLCDGTRAQNEVAKDAGLDTGNFSRMLNKWVSQGLIYRLDAGRGARLLHVYPLPE